MYFKRFACANKKSAGFSLLEVLITSAIIGIITAIAVVRYSAFNSSILLKNQAFELALAIREAQVFSISIRGEGDIFRKGYGIYFDMSDGTASKYELFLDSGTENPRAFGTGDQIVSSTVMDSRFRISSICVEDICSGDGVTTNFAVSFQRPIFDARFQADIYRADANQAVITISNVDGPQQSRTVTVSRTGQITVQ